MNVLVIDNGLAVEFARRLGLSNEFDSVSYFSPWQQDFVSTRERAVGTGFDEFERVYSISDDELRKYDAFIFPDLYWEDLAVELREQGFPVWAAFELEKLELDRVFLLDTMRRLGMKVPKHRIAKGIAEALAIAKEGDFIKTTGYARGDYETAPHEPHYPTWTTKLQRRLGPLVSDVPIVVNKPIPDEHEVGWDAILFGGEAAWPMMLGYEDKDLGYLSKVIEQFPEPLAADSLRLLSFFKGTHYTNFLSTEFRGNILIDITTRTPLPPTGMHMGFWTNLSLAIREWFESGQRPDSMKPVKKYAAEIIIHNIARDEYTWLEAPPELRSNVGLRRSFMHDGRLWSAPTLNNDMEEVGAIIGFGNTPDEAIDELRRVKEEVKMSNCLSCDCEAMYSMIKKAEQGERDGVPF